MDEPKSGVYLIRCLPTCMVYVGSSANIKARWIQHKRDFVKRKGGCIKLRNAWIKYGPDAFAWKVLEYVEPDRLIEREQHFIDLFQAANRNVGFNTRPQAGSNRGIERTEEHRAKLAAANRGRRHTEETRAKMSVAQVKRFNTPERKAKVLAARLTREACQAKREEDRRLKAEQKAMQVQKRREYMQSLEYKAIVSERSRNRSPEQLANFLKAANSPEAQAKRTAAIRARRKSGKYNYSPDALLRMSEGGRKGTIGKGPQNGCKPKAKT